MTGKPTLLLTETQHQACLSQVRDQIDAGRHPRFVTVTVKTSWGWVEGRHDEERAAVAIDKVVVRNPGRTLIEHELSGPPRTIWLYGAQPINVRLMMHVTIWLFLFGSLMATVGRLVGVWWVLAVVAAVIAPAELWARAVRRRTLRTATPGDHTRHMSQLAASPATTGVQMWAAVGDPAVAARYAAELLPSNEPPPLPPGGGYQNYPKDGGR